MRGPYWGIYAQGRGSTDQVQQGLYKNGPMANIFPVQLEQAKVSK